MLLAGQRVRAILDLYEGLPPQNLVREALMNHPEIAEVEAQRRLEAEHGDPFAEEGESPAYRSWAPRLSEYGLENRQLNELRDLAVAQLDVLRALVSKPATNLPPFPAPRTLVDDLLDGYEREDYYEGLALIAPHAMPPQAD